MKEFIKNNKGVTLLEMVVAVAIFSVAVLAAMGIFNMAIEGQRNVIAAQNLQESLRYSLEMMGKEIRMAQKVSGSDCPGFGMGNKVYRTSASELYFKNIKGECVKYFLDNNRLKIKRADNEDFLTPDEIKINKLNFYVVDDGVASEQSRVTVLIEAEAVGKEMHKQKMQIQTTISSRYYE